MNEKLKRAVAQGLKAAGMSVSDMSGGICEDRGAALMAALGCERPSRFFEYLKAQGQLAAFMPQLAALVGVEQPPEHHPEGDAFVHTMMVLDQACRRSDSTNVRFSALVHDLGKALTPVAEWPKHLLHGERGVAPIEAVCEEMGIPDEARHLAVEVSARHIGIHQSVDAKTGRVVSKAGTMRRLFEEMGLFDMDRAEASAFLGDFLTVCASDARGRLGKENTPYPQEQVLMSAWQAASTTALDEEESQKPSAAQILTSKRVRAIKKSLHDRFGCANKTLEKESSVPKVPEI